MSSINIKQEVPSPIPCEISEEIQSDLTTQPIPSLPLTPKELIISQIKSLQLKCTHWKGKYKEVCGILGLICQWIEENNEEFGFGFLSEEITQLIARAKVYYTNTSTNANATKANTKDDLTGAARAGAENHDLDHDYDQSFGGPSPCPSPSPALIEDIEQYLINPPGPDVSVTSEIDDTAKFELLISYLTKPCTVKLERIDMDAKGKRRRKYTFHVRNPRKPKPPRRPYKFHVRLPRKPMPNGQGPRISVVALKELEDLDSLPNADADTENQIENDADYIPGADAGAADEAEAQSGDEEYKPKIKTKKPRLKLPKLKKVKVNTKPSTKRKILEIPDADLYTCTVCSKTFTIKDKFRRHLKIHRPKVKSDKKRVYPIRFPCPHCPKGFYRQREIDRHIKTRHTEYPKPKKVPQVHLCSYCPKTFKSKYHLQRHLLVHTNEKPYSCDQCELTFRYPWHLKRHSYSHKGEKPFMCEHCGMGFVDKWNLKEHLNIHTGERRYKCEICGTIMTQHGSLRVHLRKIHHIINEGDGIQSGEILVLGLPQDQIPGPKSQRKRTRTTAKIERNEIEQDDDEDDYDY